MKKTYRLLWGIILAEWLLLFVLSKNGVQVKSWLGNALGIFLCLLPVEILLFLYGKDTQNSKTKRKLCNVAFWFVILAYALTVVLSIAGLVV